MARHELGTRQTLQDALEQVHTKESFGVALLEAALRESLKQAIEGVDKVVLAPTVEVQVLRKERELEAHSVVNLCVRVSVVFEETQISFMHTDLIATGCA